MFKTVMIRVFFSVAFIVCGDFALADDFSDALIRVEALNLSRGDYVLGKELTFRQKELARKQALDAAMPGTYRFNDRNLTVVVDKDTDRVVILYEHHKDATEEKTKEMVGALFLDFGDPTTMAHDRTVYWVFGPNGKLTREAYRKIKENKGHLNVLATIKLNSSHRITGKDSKEEKRGEVYYIISAKAIHKYPEEGVK